MDMPSDEKMMADLADYIQRELSLDPDIDIEPDDQIIATGLMDSFSLVELRAHIEKTYGVFLPDHRVTGESFSSVRNMVPVIHEFLSAAAQ